MHLHHPFPDPYQLICIILSMSAKILVFYILPFLFIQTGMGQIRIEGRVFSLPEKEPIPFANIGILNGTVGTISDFDGTFSMDISNRFLRDSLIFSALGYQEVKIPVRNLLQKNNLNVYLKEMVYKLSEVIVTADRGKTKSILAGNPQFEGSSLYADTVNAGAAMALLIKNRNRKDKIKYEYPVYLQEAEVMIQHNTFEQFKVRVRIYEAIERGGKLIPGKDLLHESLVVESKITDGWLSFDLTPYRHKVEKDFFIAFEWILERKDRANLYRQYHSFKKENPDKVAINYSVVDGKKVIFENYQGNFYFGTSFGMSVANSIIRENICYYRLNSFGQWFSCPSVLAARVSVGKWLDHLEVNTSQENEEESDNEVLSHYVLQAREADPSTGGDVDDLSGSYIFHRRMPEPLEIYVSRDQNRLSFYAWNRAQYPYQLTLLFSNIHNLQPLVTSKTFTVVPGRKQLLNLEVVDQDVENYHYELSVSEVIGDPQWQTDSLYPYLPPVQRLSQIKSSGTAAVNIFPVERGDKILAMRKGIVTAIPDGTGHLDRIGSDYSLEILHADGTIMVYEGIEFTGLEVKPGSVVIPGETLGYGTDSVRVQLFKILAGENLQSIPVYYYSNSGKVIPYSDLRPALSLTPPDSLIERELTESEKRKRKREDH